MGEDIAVAITAHNRPKYLEVILDSWGLVRGIEDTPVHFQVEPVNPYVKDLCDYAPFSHRSMEVNRTTLGPLSNPYAALKSGFEMGAKFVVLGEDDSIVTADVLEYFQWAANEFRDNQRIMAVCSFQHKPLGPLDAACFRDYFASVVWGTWVDRWEDWMRESWGHTYTDGEWDFRFCRWCETKFKCVFPCISRSQHIGRDDGTHMKPEKFERLQAKAIHDGSPVDWRML
jgi:hypothetical protein